MSAGSTRVPPASTKATSWLAASSASVSTPHVLVPSAIRETRSPERPSSRFSTTAEPSGRPLEILTKVSRVAHKGPVRVWPRATRSDSRLLGSGERPRGPGLGATGGRAGLRRRVGGGSVRLGRRHRADLDRGADVADRRRRRRAAVPCPYPGDV